METMPPSEFKQWVAYFSLEDEEYKQKLEHKVALEKSESEQSERKSLTEERAMEIRAMLMGLGE